MKIAIGYYGTVSGLTGKSGDITDGQQVSLTTSHDSVLKCLVEPNKEHTIDFFIHSWSDNIKDSIVYTIQPKLYLIEPQIKMKTPAHLPENDRIHNTYSRWYSTLQTSKLISEYEEINGQYDLIMISRLDLVWSDPLLFSFINANKFYTSNIINGDKQLWGWPWTNLPEIADHFFISNSSNIHKFSLLYECLDEYTKPGQCNSWNSISSHMLALWHLRKLGIDDIGFVKYWYKNSNLGDYSFIRHTVA